MNKENILLKNDFIIYSVINKYLKYFDKDDLYQVGMIGLINAYNNYDINSKAKFSSYAYFYVKGEVTKYIRESSLIKSSRDIINLNSKIEKTRELLTNKLGHEVTNNEIALFLEIDERQIEYASNFKDLLISLDNSYDEDYNLYDYIGFEEKSYKEELIDLKNALLSLNEFEKNLISKRYNEGLTQNELSKELGINQIKVSRCEKKILTKLKARL